MKKSLTIVTRSIPAHGPGGMERATWTVATGLIESGWAVEILTTSLPKGDFIEPNGLRVRAIPGSPPNRYSGVFFRGVRKILAQGNRTAPVLGVSAAGFDYLSISRKDRRPTVLVCHGTSLDEIRSKLKTRTPRAWLGMIRQLAWLPKDIVAYRRADAIITVNDPLTDQIRSLLPESHRKKVTTIYNGFNAPSSNPIPPSGDFAVCTSGRLVREKGIHLLLQAIALIPANERPRSVFICGSGPELPALSTQAASLGLTGVFFLGHVADVFPTIRQSSLLVLPSLRLEGLPLSIIEALSVGCSVLVPSTLPFPNVSQPGIHRFQTGDSQDLARALRDGRLRTRHIGLVPELSLEKMIGAYSEVLHGMIANKSFLSTAANASP